MRPPDSITGRLRPAAAAATLALMGCLSDGVAWSTGDLQIATGLGAAGNLVYRLLTRLRGLGHVAKSGGRPSGGLGECYWRWLPSEGTCDLLPAWEGPVPVRCGCWSWGRCWSCRRWALANLGAEPPIRPRPVGGR